MRFPATTLEASRVLDNAERCQGPIHLILRWAPCWLGVAGRDINCQPTLTPTEAWPRKNWVTLLVLGVNVGPSLSCSSKEMVHYSVLHRVYTVHIFARDHGSPSHSTPAEIGQPRRSPVGSAIKQCAERCGSGSSVWNLSKVDSKWNIV